MLKGKGEDLGNKGWPSPGIVYREAQVYGRLYKSKCRGREVTMPDRGEQSSAKRAGGRPGRQMKPGRTRRRRRAPVLRSPRRSRRQVQRSDSPAAACRRRSACSAPCSSPWRWWWWWWWWMLPLLALSRRFPHVDDAEVQIPLF